MSAEADMAVITGKDLLQANATVIAGLLIFTTLSPITKLFEATQRYTIIFSVFIAVGFLIASIIYLLFLPPEELYLFRAKLMFVIGLWCACYTNRSIVNR